MTRTMVNFVVDLLTMVGVLAVVVTGLFLRYVMPPGSPKYGISLFDMTRHDWGEIHFWTTVGLGVLVLVHLALHWRWVCTTLSRKVLRRKAGSAALPPFTRNLVGVAVLALIVAFVSVVVQTARNVAGTEAVYGASVEQGSGQGGGEGRQLRGGGR